MEQVFVSGLVSERFSQLLARPLRARMGSDVRVNQPAAVVFDDDEYVQNSERARHGHEEVARHDGPRMISKECGPPLIASGRPGVRRGRYFLTVRGETR